MLLFDKLVKREKTTTRIFPLIDGFLPYAISGRGVDLECLASRFWNRSRRRSVCSERMRSQSVSVGLVGSKTRSVEGMSGEDGSCECRFL